MQKNNQVILCPPDVTQNGLYLLAVDAEPWGGWVRSDGSHTQGNDMTREANQAVGFRNAEDALDWAKAQGYQVINAGLPKRPSMPTRFTVAVTSAQYTPPYAYHESVVRRQQANESVAQAEIKFKPLDLTTPWGGCYILIDQVAIRQLQAAGIESPAGLIGRMLVLKADDPSDPTCPLQIVQIQ